MLTAAQKKRLAREARKLAMECLTNGPLMSDSWCGCAIGTCLNRAGLWRGDDADFDSRTIARNLEREFSGLGDDDPLPGTHGLLSEATRERTYRANPTAVVIPLLSWADALEEAAP